MANLKSNKVVKLLDMRSIDMGIEWVWINFHILLIAEIHLLVF